MKSWKKGLSLCLALLMCFSLLPTAALAEGEEEAAPAVEAEAVELGAPAEPEAAPAIEAEAVGEPVQAEDDGGEARESGLVIRGYEPDGDVWVSAGDAVKIHALAMTNGDYEGGLAFEWGTLTLDGASQDVYTAVPGAVEETFTGPEMTEAMHLDRYRVRVTDDYGYTAEKDYRLRLDSGLKLSAFKDMSYGTRDFVVSPGETATLTVYSVVNGALEHQELTYRWYRGDVLPENLIAGEDRAVYTTGPVQEFTEYTCVVTDYFGSPRYVSFRVCLENHLTAEPVGPQNFYLDPNDITGVTAEALPSADDESELAISWHVRYGNGYYDTWEPLPDADGQTFCTVSAAEIKRFCEKSDHCTLIFRVSDQYGNSADCEFDIYLREFYGSFELRIKDTNSESEGFAVPYGEPFSMEVEPEYYEGYEGTALTYHWYHEGEEVEGATGPVLVSEPVTTYTYYECTAYDEANAWDGSVYIALWVDSGLRVAVPGGDTFGVQPGGSVTLEVEARANEGVEISYQWYDDSYDKIEGATEPVLFVEDIYTSSVYYCVVRDEYGYSTEADFLVYVDSGLYAEPVGSPEIPVTPGDSITLEVNASVNFGALHYQWYDTHKDDLADETGPTLLVENVTAYARYTCEVSDDYGNCVEIKFSVYPENHLEVAALTPVEFFVPYGDPATVQARVTADDTEGMTLIWYFGGTEEEQEFTEEPSYTIPSVGRYCRLTLEATDKYGNTTGVYFDIGVENHFRAEAVEPEVTVPRGESAVLQVLAQADIEGFTYTWYRHEGTMDEADWSNQQLDEHSDTLVTPAITEPTYYFCQVEDCYENWITVEFTVSPIETTPDPYDVYWWLESIDTGELSPEEIRDAVQEISTEALLDAMLADRDVVEELRRLEDAAGSPTVVASSVPELEGAAAVGAGLNDTIGEGPVTLIIDAPAWDDALPAGYDPDTALRFSMHLENVADTENLKVPVQVDLPIPYRFDPNVMVFLHYPADGGEPEILSPHIYWSTDYGYYRAQFVLTSFSDFVFAQRYLSDEPVALNRYLLLVEGERATPQLFGWTNTVSDAAFRVTDENGKPFEDAPVIELTDSFTGEILALRPGTAYLVADIERIIDYETYGHYDENGELIIEENPICRMETIRCRVDVIPAENAAGEELDAPVGAAVTRATLRDSKATVELFRTDYTTVTVLLEMPGLLEGQALLPEWELPDLEDQGVAIESAAFTGEGAELFSLKVVDDRTLAIVPTYEALEAAQAKSSNVKKSYKLGISLVLSDGTGLTVQKADGTDAVLALTVKQSKPSLKFGALKFNSLIPDDGRSFAFKGSTVTSLEPDLEAAQKAGKEAVPAWLEIYSDYAFLTHEAPPTASGKLYLLATLDGWAIRKAITVSYSVKPTAPKISFKASSLTIGRTSWAETVVTLKPSDFDQNNNLYFDARIMESGVECSDSVLSLSMYRKSYSSKQSTFYFDVSCGDIPDSAAHTYKVLLTLVNALTEAPVGKAATLTVKVRAEDRTLKMWQGGKIEALTGDGNIYLGTDFKGYQMTGEEVYGTTFGYVPKGGKAELDVPVNEYLYDDWTGEVTQLGEYREDAAFDVQLDGNVVYINLNSGNPQPLPKGTYYAHSTVTFPDGSTKTAKTKLNIKWTDPAKAKTVTAKVSDAKGAIDPIRAGTMVTFRVTGADGTYYMNLRDYEVYETVGKAKRLLSADEIPFELQDGYWPYKTDSRYCTAMYLKDDAVLTPGASYSIRFRFADFPGLNEWSKEYKIPVKMGAVKLQAIPQVTLLTSDRFSNAEFMITPKDRSVNPVSKITLDSKSAALFEVHEVGNGRWAIGYKDNVIPASLKAGATKTVKLGVFFEGNVTDKANVTVSLKVKLK